MPRRARRDGADGGSRVRDVDGGDEMTRSVVSARPPKTKRKPSSLSHQPLAISHGVKPSALSPEGYAMARRYLMRHDPILGAAIRKIGACGMADRQRKDHLSALVGAIVSQQLSTKRPKMVAAV